MMSTQTRLATVRAQQAWCSTDTCTHQSGRLTGCCHLIVGQLPLEVEAGVPGVAEEGGQPGQVLQLYGGVDGEALQSGASRNIGH